MATSLSSRAKIGAIAILIIISLFYYSVTYLYVFNLDFILEAHKLDFFESKNFTKSNKTDSKMDKPATNSTNKAPPSTSPPIIVPYQKLTKQQELAKELEFLNSKLTPQELKEDEEYRKGLEKTLKIEFERMAYFKMRRKREDEIIQKRPKPKPRDPSNPVTINMMCGNCRWGHMNFMDLVWVRGCKVPCRVIADPNYQKTDLLYALETTTALNNVKKANPGLTKLKYGLFATESLIDHDCRHLTDIKEFSKCMDGMDMISFFSRDSDVTLNYAYAFMPRHSHTKQDTIDVFKSLANLPKRTYHPDVLASTWISNCGGNVRNQLIAGLNKRIKLHHYGGCWRNSQSSDKVSTQQNYKFTFAFENTIVNDYITEKYYQGLISNNVMIYLGSPTIEEISPVQSEKVMINALHYAPNQLAVLLELLGFNDTEYQKYHQWRKKPVSNEFLNSVQNNFILQGPESWLCRSCEYYHKRFD